MTKSDFEDFPDAKPFRRRPESVWAIHWNSMDGWDRACEIARWCNGTALRDDSREEQKSKTYYWHIRLWTTNGPLYVTPGSWIVFGDKGFRGLTSKEFTAEFEPDE